MLKKFLLALGFAAAVLSPLVLTSYAHAAGCSAGVQGATQVIATASSGNIAAGTATATLAAPNAAQRWNITAFEITGLGATSALGVAPTITGLDNGSGASATATYSFAAVGTATLIDEPLIVTFPCPLSGAPGTAVVLSMPTLGTGNTNAAVTIHGFVQ